MWSGLCSEKRLFLLGVVETDHLSTCLYGSGMFKLVFHDTVISTLEVTDLVPNVLFEQLEVVYQYPKDSM